MWAGNQFNLKVKRLKEFFTSLKGGYYTSFKHPLPLLLLPLAVIVLTSCDTWSVKHLEVPAVSTKAYQEYKTKIDQQKNIIEQKCVFIDGLDIQLPLTAGDFDPQGNRTYSFYIWAYDANAPVAKTLEQMREDGSFSLEVIGAKASINVPDYLPPTGLPQPLTSASSGISPDNLAAMQSRNVLEVRIRSQDLTGPFTIVAWFPDKYRTWESQQWQTQNQTPGRDRQRPQSQNNPYGEKRAIKVYNGDLRTRIDIVDEREAESSFGSQFAKRFYVGRVYLRNRHSDKRMVVYTTSLRANILFYRPPISDRITNAPPSRRSGSDVPMADPQTQYWQEDLTSKQKRGLAKDYKHQRNEALGSHALNAAINQAFYDSEGNLFISEEQQSASASNIIKKVVSEAGIKPDEQTSNTIYSAVMLVWNRLGQQVQAATNEAAASDAKAMGFAQDELSAVPVGTDEEQVLRVNIFPALFRLGGMGDDSEISGHYYSATNAIAKAGLSSAEQARLVSLAQKIRDERLHAEQERMLARALSHNSPQILNHAGEFGVPVALEYEQIIGDIRQEALAKNTTSPNPFATRKDILVNPDARALAFSDSSDRQRELDKIGYLWHDTYRPMTFQAVLNSLMFTDENTYSARTMQVLQTAATIAGGMAGLGSVSSGLASQGYLQGVNFFSTIFVPATGKLILDDVNKHIRNLGDMGMDTVVIVPPNDVVDHYIFFPKGPIYNYADEFDVSSPSYIKRIDNDDVAVEATLIDQGVNVQGGGLTADALTDRALNEGQSQMDADVAKQASLSARLHQLTLSTTAAKIQALLNSAPLGSNSVKNVKRIQVEKQVCALAKIFESQFGVDTSGTLSGLLADVDCDNSPPSVILNLMPAVDLFPGVPSGQFVLPVSDLLGVWNLKITNSSNDQLLIPSTNVQVQLPAKNTDGFAHFTVLAASNPGLRADAPATITFTISNDFQLTSTLPVPATIHLPQFQFANISGGKIANGAFTPDNPGNVASVNVILPVYDSDLSGDLLTNWSFAPFNLQTNGWVVAADPNGLQKQSGTGAQQAITMNLAIDASMATNKLAPLDITVSYRNQVVASTNLQLTLPPGNQ